MNLENLRNEALIDLYYKLVDELEDLESDIKYTLAALDDSGVDYMQKTEFKNDLSYDRQRINIVKPKIDAIIAYANQNGISLERQGKKIL